MRFILFGDGLWATKSLASLTDKGHQCAGVVLRQVPTEPTLQEYAKAHTIPTFSLRNVNAEDSVALLSRLNADLGLSIAFNQILRAPAFSVPRHGTVNFHAGKLPQYRGRNVVNWAIINGETEIGLTAHFIDEGIDSGDILLQRLLPIAWTDTYGDVLARIVDDFPGFVVETVESLERGTADRRPQDHSRATYMPGRQSGDEWVDWNDPSRTLYNKIRGITRPGPGARTWLRDQPVILWQASYDPGWPAYLATPGVVVGKATQGVVVKTGDSTLLLREVQVGNGSPSVPAWAIGTRLGISAQASVPAILDRLARLEAHAAAARSDNADS